MNQPAVLLSSAGRSLLRDTCTLLQLPLQPQKHLPGTKPPSLTAATPPAAAAAAAWTNADVAGPDGIAAMAAAVPDLGALRQYLAAARGSEVRLDQGSAEACVARFRALQTEDAGLGWQDLNTFITVSLSSACDCCWCCWGCLLELFLCVERDGGSWSVVSAAYREE